jgi:hypothetical protein
MMCLIFYHVRNSAVAIHAATLADFDLRPVEPDHATSEACRPSARIILLQGVKLYLTCQCPGRI